MRIKTLIIFYILSLSSGLVQADNLSEKFNEANTLILAKDYSKAKKILETLLTKNPDNVEVINNLAFIEAKTGKIDEAIKILRGSISKNKNIDTIYKNLTNLYAFRANILYEEALSIKESDNEISLSLITNSSFKSSDAKVVQSKKKLDINEKPLFKVNENNIKNFIIEWAGFWQNKNYQEYFNSYASNYFPEKFKSRESWQKDRKAKIQNKKNINIKVSNIKIITNDEKNILVQFTQAYNSDSFSDVVKKHTTISIEKNSFKITGEYIIK